MDPKHSTHFLPFARPDITEDEVSAIADSVRSGWLTTGPISAAFEREMAEFLGGGDIQCVAVNSATAGLHLAVEALGIKDGDEVLVPTWTFTATAEVVRYMGAHPILVDVDPVTLNIDFNDAERKLTDKTRAIIPVHFAGMPVNAAALTTFANEHGLQVVEDAAHAFPARSGTSYVGNSDSAAVVFSFYATKTLTTGEGGMVVVKSRELADRMRTMRLHGISRDVFDRYRSNVPSWKYDVVAPGFKYNLPDTAASLGRVQLRRAVAMRERRREIAFTYFDALADLAIQLPPRGDSPQGHAWHLFVIRVTSNETGLHRDEFIERMSHEGVGTSVHFIPLHMHPFWRETYGLQSASFPSATRQFQETVSLPIYSSLTDRQVDKVISAVRNVVNAG